MSKKGKYKDPYFLQSLDDRDLIAELDGYEYDEEDVIEEIENRGITGYSASVSGGGTIIGVLLLIGIVFIVAVIYFSLLGFGAGVYFSIEYQIPIYMFFAMTFVGIFFSQGSSKLANFCFAIATAALISRIFPLFMPEVNSLRVEDFQEWSKITPKSTAYQYTLYYFLAITIIPYAIMKILSKKVRARNGIGRNINRGM